MAAVVREMNPLDVARLLRAAERTVMHYQQGPGLITNGVCIMTYTMHDNPARTWWALFMQAFGEYDV